MERATTQLRKLLARPGCVVAPGVADGLRDKVATFKQFTEIAGLPEIRQLEARYGVPEDQRASL